IASMCVIFRLSLLMVKTHAILTMPFCASAAKVAGVCMWRSRMSPIMCKSKVRWMLKRARGNSVYFPDYVVPMLPEALSNGLCSLNPSVDRLCMVCEMNISDAGRITGYQFYEGVMHSHARLTYTKVGEILTGEGDARNALREEYKKVVPQLELLHKLYECLRKARDERGAIDFETVETRIQFNEDRKIERIVPIKRNDAHKLIEECMLCANVCAATFIEKHNLLGLFRVHEG